MRYTLSLLLLLLSAAPLPSNAQSLGAETLAHLDGVSVAVEEMSKSLRQSGVTRESLKANAELVLRRSGIEVHSDLHPKSSGLLRLTITTASSSEAAFEDVYAYSVSLKLDQAVRLMSGKADIATTYEIAGITGIAGRNNLGQVEEDAIGMVKTFANDWLAAHQ